MLLALFEATGITRKKVYHGTPDKSKFGEGDAYFGYTSPTLSVGTKGIAWFTDNYDTAKTYANPYRAFDIQEAEPAVLTLYITMANPLIVDAGGLRWKDAIFKVNGVPIQGTNQLVAYAKKNGYDGVVVKNVYDNYNHFKGEDKKKKYLADTYAVFSDEQIHTTEK
jgi:hypothetical protein